VYIPPAASKRQGKHETMREKKMKQKEKIEKKYFESGPQNWFDLQNK